MQIWAEENVGRGSSLKLTLNEHGTITICWERSISKLEAHERRLRELKTFFFTELFYPFIPNIRCEDTNLPKNLLKVHFVSLILEIERGLVTRTQRFWSFQSSSLLKKIPQAYVSNNCSSTLPYFHVPEYASLTEGLPFDHLTTGCLW